MKGTTMAKVSLQSAYNISPNQIWALIGTFSALSDRHPAIQSSRLEDDGQVGRLSLLGGEIVGPLEPIKAKERLYRYRIVNRQLSVANYTATLRVCDDGAGSGRRGLVRRIRARHPGQRSNRHGARHLSGRPRQA
jgi:hypothetical protein